LKKLLALVLFALAGTAFAQQQVPSIWAFNIANIQGSYYRALLDQANQDQKKYQFVPEHKPGAGGAIGAGHVLGQERLVLLGTAAAYFVRPYLYKDTPYNFDQFRPVHVMANSPAALVTKDKNLADILKQDRIAIGTAGAGSLTHLMALKFKEQLPNKDAAIIVAYKSSTEALQDVLGGHIDLTFEFLGDAEAKNAKVLGVTGRNKIKDYPLLKDMGYTGQADMVGVYLILVKKDVPADQVAELRKIFVDAEKSQRVQDLYKSDYSSKPVNLRTEADYQRWYKETIEYYRSVTAGQRVE
jgi:tripartite-type tricarboxylate transporter receptor subunit TctC